VIASAESTREHLSDREIVFRRVLDAPRELVWKVWSDPRHIHEWWGPVGFTTTTQEFSFVEGGVWRSVMHGPDGTDYPTRIVFREIVEPSRLVYENGWDLPGAPLDFTMVCELVAEGAKTRFSMRMIFADANALKTAVERYGVLPGGTQTLDRLAEYVSGLE
jgi:uncharacterized protein YndB with AHSA1/START domain